MGRSPFGDAARAPSDVLGRVKAASSSEHIAIEADFDLASMTLDAYGSRLESFLAFYDRHESRLGELGDWEGRGINLAARSKRALLEDDLRALGSMGPRAVCPEIVRLTNLADGFGWLYVIEGSSLGGKVIARHLSAKLGITRENGGRYFHGYGERTGDMWRAFRVALTTYAESAPQEEERIIVAARATFGALRRCLKGCSERP